MKKSFRYLIIATSLLTITNGGSLVNAAVANPTEQNPSSTSNVFDTFLPSSNDINALIRDIKGLVRDIFRGDISRFKSVFYSRFNTYLSRVISTGLDTVYSGIAGVMGIPDPQLIENLVSGILDGNIDSFFDAALQATIDLALPGGNSPEIQQKIETDTIIAIADGVADSSILSNQAQQQNLAKLEQIEALTNTSVDLAGDSQGRDISQDILKNISQQMANSQTLQGALYAEINSSKLDRAISNKVLANILKETQKNNQRKIRENASMGRLLINQPTYVMPGILARQQ